MPPSPIADCFLQIINGQLLAHLVRLLIFT